MQIKELTIYSSNIKEQAKFYTQVLSLTAVNNTDKLISLAIGQSILHIVYKAQTTPYHFAVNIPANKEEEALAWLKERVELLKDGNHEIQDFDFWNAKAIYFYDEDLNIIELIARKNLDNTSKQVFDVNHFLEISEIGIPTNDIEKVYKQLAALTEIQVFDGSFERFCAIGDEHGLFICINKQIKDWFPTNDKAYASPFQIKLIEQDKNYELEYKDEVISAAKE